jgi:hypothetical protein
MSGRVYLLGVGLALVALAFILTDVLIWRPGVTEANIRRIRAGMTLREVEAMFGGPAQEEYDLAGEQGFRPCERWGKLWGGEPGWAAVIFNANGIVTRCVYHPRYNDEA